MASTLPWSVLRDVVEVAPAESSSRGTLLLRWAVSCTSKRSPSRKTSGRALNPGVPMYAGSRRPS